MVKININFIILTILKWEVQWHEVHSHYCTSITTIHFQNVLRLAELKLYSSNTNFPPPAPPCPNKHKPQHSPSVSDFAPLGTSWVESYSIGLFEIGLFQVSDVIKVQQHVGTVFSPNPRALELGINSEVLRS